MFTLFNKLNSWSDIFVSCHSDLVCVGYDVLRDEFLYLNGRWENILNDTPGYTHFFTNILSCDSKKTLKLAVKKYRKRGFNCDYVYITHNLYTHTHTTDEKIFENDNESLLYEQLLGEIFSSSSNGLIFDNKSEYFISRYGNNFVSKLEDVENVEDESGSENWDEDVWAGVLVKSQDEDDVISNANDLKQNNLINVLLLKYSGIRNIAFSQTIKRLYFDSYANPLEIDMWKLCDAIKSLGKDVIKFLVTPGLLNFDSYHCRVNECIQRDLKTVVNKDLIDYIHEYCDYVNCQCDSFCKKLCKEKFDLFVQYNCDVMMTPQFSLKCFLLQPSLFPKSENIKKIVLPR